MSRKRKGKFTLVEAIDFLDETTIVGNYPADGTGVSDGDDTPTSNILMAPRYKQVPYFNKLTPFNKNWDHDNGKWYWDDFENAGGQEASKSYSNTLKSMKSLFPKDTWELAWKRIKNVPDKEIERELGGHRKEQKVKNLLGKEKSTHIEIKTKNKMEVKDTKLKNENKRLTKRIDQIIM